MPNKTIESRTDKKLELNKQDNLPTDVIPDMDADSDSDNEQENEDIQENVDKAGSVHQRQEGSLSEVSTPEQKSSRLKQRRLFPKRGDWILYKNKDEEIWHKAKIIEKTSKSSVTKNIHYNIDREHGGKAGIVLDHFDYKIISDPVSKTFNPSPSIHNEIEYDGDSIDKAEILESENAAYVVFIPKKDWDKPFVVEAKQKELKNFQSYGAYKEVLDEGQQRLTSGWVVTEKLYGDVVGCKARLVVHGNQETFDLRKDSPTVTKQTLRLVFSLAAQYGWEVIISDVTSAFLQSDKLDREIYVQPPADVRTPGTLWRLLKPMYGLEDAGLKWYQTVDSKLKKLGCLRLNTDLAVFYYIKDGKLRGIAGWHVDDMITTGEELFYTDIVKPLMTDITFGSTSEGSYRCLGWNVRHLDGSIHVSQSDYIVSKVDYLDIRKGNRSNQDKLSEDEIAEVRTKIGKLRWLSDQTRPDISYELLELSMGAHDPTVGMINQINKVVTAVNSRDVELKYSKLEQDKWHISVFSDASLRGLPGKIQSAMGYLVFLSDGYIPNKQTKCCILQWKSCKVKPVVTSTYDAETIALELGLEEALIIKDQIMKMTGFGEELMKVEAFVDCRDTFEAIMSNKQFPKGSRLAMIEVAKIKEMLDQKKVDGISWVDTAHQLADVLTKKGVDVEPLVETISSGKFFK